MFKKFDQFNRRIFIQKSLFALSVLTTASLPMNNILASTDKKKKSRTFSPLKKDPQGIIDLPEGFTYKILQKKKTMMSDGYLVPGHPDGMGCFESSSNPDHLILMRNHEISTGDFANGPYAKGQKVSPLAYNSNGYGGVSRLVIHKKTLDLVSSNLVLIGTARNCAGGNSPWGWLTCEESVEENHGYVFLCSPQADQLEAPQKLTNYGRFNHEAAIVDPTTNITYLTEDRADSCFYRFVPHQKDRPFEGELQAMRVKNKMKFLTHRHMKQGDLLSVDWVKIDELDSPVKSDKIRKEAQKKGAAIVARGEGICLGSDGKIYFTATSGGPIHAGQVFCFIPDKNNQEGELLLLAQSNSYSQMDMPDNIMINQRGCLYIAEDGVFTPHLLGINNQGDLFKFAKNAMSSSEFTGVCCSPDGNTVFVNIQKDGLTLAISGPFQDFEEGKS